MQLTNTCDRKTLTDRTLIDRDQHLTHQIQIK